MRSSTRTSTGHSSFAVVDQWVEFDVSADPDGLMVNLGVPDDVIAEEPSYNIRLSQEEALALRDWLNKVYP